MGKQELEKFGNMFGKFAGWEKKERRKVNKIWKIIRKGRKREKMNEGYDLKN